MEFSQFILVFKFGNTRIPQISMKSFHLEWLAEGKA